MPIGEREKLFETDLYEAYGELVTEGLQPPKYHVWIYYKRSHLIGLEEPQIKEIIQNLKDFGKWDKFKKLKKELNE